MADTILTRKQLELEFALQTANILGVEITIDEDGNITATPEGRIRIAWPPVGAPTWGRAENVVFIRLNEISDPITMQRDVSYSAVDVDNASRKAKYTRVHRIQWVLYGPSAWDDADKIRSGLFLPDIKLAFAQKNLYLVLDVQAPVRVPEPYAGQWWERVDFAAHYNEFVVRQGTTPLIKTAEIITKEG